MLQHLQIQDLEVLLAVAETGSFRKAASRFDVQQSAVSRRIRKVEEILGVSLFERGPSGASLTLAGSSFAGDARGVVRDLKIAATGAEAKAIADAGRLRIGLLASLSQGALREVMSAFLRDHRSVELRLMEAERSELLAALSHREIDLIVAAGEPDTDFGDSMIVSREAVYLALNVNHPLASCERIEWSEAQDLVFLVSAREPGPEIEDYIVRKVSDLNHRATLQRHRLDREGIMNLVSLGLGVSVVASHCRGINYPNVVFVPIGNPDETIPFSITWRPENDNPALRRFLSLARIEAKRNGLPF